MLRSRGSWLLALVGLIAGIPGWEKQMAARAGADPAVPDYEVKLFLVPAKVLDEDGHPKKDVREELKLKKDPVKMRMQFIDGKNHELHSAGWDVRLRRREDHDKFELTYKRRYPVEKDGLDAVLARAASEGFGREEKDYEAQVEWGYMKRTLSFSHDKALDRSGYHGMDLPTLKDSTKVCLAKIPGKLDRRAPKGWARDVLSGAALYGPVKGKRWSGTWEKTDVDFEVWEIRGEAGKGIETVVEVSFKEKHEKKAGKLRQELIELLKKKGWLLPKDVLKTEMILSRY